MKVETDVIILNIDDLVKGVDTVSNNKEVTENQERSEETMGNKEAKRTVIQNIVDSVKQLLETNETLDAYFANMEVPQFVKMTSEVKSDEPTTSEPEVNEDVLADDLNIMVDDVWALDDDLVRVVKIVNDKEIEVMFEDFSTCIVNTEEFVDEWDLVGRAVYPYTLLKQMAFDVR